MAVNAKTKSSYEVTMLLRGDMCARLDSLAERGMQLRKSMGMPVGHLGIRDVLTQALELGVDVLERSLVQTETKDRRVLLPNEWAAKLGQPGPVRPG